MTLGERIKERRIAVGLTIDQVAEQLNKNRATIYRYENSKIQNLPVTVLEPLSTILQTTPDFLMGWNDIKKESNAFDALKVLLAAVYDHITIDEDHNTGSYQIILLKNETKICLDEIPFETLFHTICSILPACVEQIDKNTQNGEHERMLDITCLQPDEVIMLDMYRRLDSNDRAETRGEMKQMLKSEKYTTK